MYPKKYHKLIKLLICCCVLCCSFSFARTNVSAAVKATVKNGVCTVSGKGKMKQKFEGNKKIKKVVIKKGVTYIPKSAFMNCTKLKSVSIANTVKAIDDGAFADTGLKKITVPKSVKEIGYLALDSNFKKIKMPGNCEPIRYDNDGTDCFFLHVKTVEFTTPLDLTTFYYIRCEKVVISAEDPKYKSINGAVYSKNGKTLCGVPAGKKELKISDKCTKIKFSAFEYNLGDYDEYPSVSLRNITIPESFVSFVYDKDAIDRKINLPELKTIKLPRKEFGKDNVNFIFKHFVLNETILNCLSENGYINYNNGFLIGDASGIACSSSDANILYGYFGKKEEVVIPECVEIIDDFRGSEGKMLAKKVTLGFNVKEVKDFAFADGEWLENNLDLNNLEEVILNERLVKIGANAFSNTELKTIVLPESLEYVGDEAFGGTMIEDIVIPANLISYEGAFSEMKNLKKAIISHGITTIPEYAFYGCEKLEEVIIPDTLCSISENAFWDCDLLNTSIIYAQVEKNKELCNNPTG